MCTKNEVGILCLKSVGPYYMVPNGFSESNSMIFHDSFPDISGLSIDDLRILDIHGAKTHKNQTPLACLPQ